ncbi:MAG: beta-eliminating lyase-related protein [Paracoccus sp. (in: a-proteobacteria)]|uniref:threonine aldolase family protein n=1 Tax=Paracoccus sp. TaxID=267 RepID=UPI0026DF230E|nr:beta-eliminating lyase-related protein [Paracoccus sp. (in: a-proteobacteria)]MDO5630502.1 beta-eliminating lyase-related protein [Paracoccus sp. (in: a-proteobacteria)]
MNFGSDNWSGVHPAIWDAMGRANDGLVPGYGRDDLTAAAVAAVRQTFEAPQAEVFLLGTGTGSNALALSQICPSWGRIFCHEAAHIHTSESGAPGYLSGGAQLALVPGADGRITPDALRDTLAIYPQVDEHDGQNAVLSITNASECGRVYGPADLAALADVAHAAGMLVHLDGARFANAVAAAGASPADLTWRAGVDALSLGGTKNGCMALEAVVIFDPARTAGFRFRRMRAGQLWSKHRFLAAQMLAWLDGGLWLDLARHANAMAADLAQGLTPIWPVEANEVFLRLPTARISALRAAGLQAADWDMPDNGTDSAAIRLVTSWATAPEQVAAARAVLLADQVRT